jgi:endogenous inhibitor of DNA gyrase (YacG/DUF329 family)
MAATVRCPICGKQVPLDDPNAPFCSDRCRTIDLSNWASEKYVISEPLTSSDLENLPADELAEGLRR